MLPPVKPPSEGDQFRQQLAAFEAGIESEPVPLPQAPPPSSQQQRALEQLAAESQAFNSDVQAGKIHLATLGNARAFTLDGSGQIFVERPMDEGGGFAPAELYVPPSKE